MDTGNIMENQLQDQIDAYEHAVSNDEGIQLLLEAKKAIYEKAPVKYVKKGSELVRVFDQEVENALFYIGEMIDLRIETIKDSYKF